MKLLKGITYGFNRNIGIQDRIIRTLIGIIAMFGAIYFSSSNTTYSIGLGILAIAQFGTVLSSRCIMCYFLGACTIDNNEKKSLKNRGIKFFNN